MTEIATVFGVTLSSDLLLIIS